MLKFACASNRYAAFMVESLTDRGKFYLVEFDYTQNLEFDGKSNYANFKENWKCECPAFKHRKGHCKHIIMMKPRLCKWQQILTSKVEPVRNGDGRLRCPVCAGDVFVDLSVFDDSQF